MWCGEPSYCRYYTEALLLSDESADAHIGNVEIQVEVTYFNPYGASQLDAIASDKWPVTLPSDSGGLGVV